MNEVYYMKLYEVYYRGVLMAKVIDYGGGLRDLLMSMNAEVDLVDVDAIKGASHINVNQQVDTVSGVLTGLKIDTLG